MIVSMDALFGLPRRKLAGQSYRQPLHGHLYFRDQQAVDEHVACAPQGLKHDKVQTNIVVYLRPLAYLFIISQPCSDFLAGDVLRSSTRYKSLDETAVFGCACRHEFPLMFIDLKHGERFVTDYNVYVHTYHSFISRLAYPEWLLLEMTPTDVKIHVMYDIACTLKKHMEVSNMILIL